MPTKRRDRISPILADRWWNDISLILQEEIRDEDEPRFYVTVCMKRVFVL